MAKLKHKGILFNLGGRMLVIPSIIRPDLEKLKVSSKNFSDDLSDPACLPALINAIHSTILRNYPDMTREAVSEGIDFSNLGKLVEAVMDVRGTKQKQIEAKMRRLNS